MRAPAIATLAIVTCLCGHPVLAQATPGDPVRMLWMYHAHGSGSSSQQVWQKHCQVLDTLTQVFEQHGGRVCVGATWEFANGCATHGNGPSYPGSIGDLAARGNEIAFHDHGNLSQATALIQSLSSPYSSRGYPKHYEGDPATTDHATLAALGYQTISGTPKNVGNQLFGVDQRGFRPKNLDPFNQDPAGLMIGVTSGTSNPVDKFDAESMEEMTRALEEAIAAHVPGKVSFHHLGLIHPDTFINLSSAELAAQAATLDAWLTAEVDPLVSQGVVVWADSLEMADAYRAWEQAGGSNADMFPTPNVTHPAWSWLDTSNSGLPTDSVEEVLTDSQGRVWFGSGTDGGLTVLDGGTYTTYAPGTSPLKSGRITSIAEGPTGDIWVTTSGSVAEAAVYRINGTTFTVWDRTNSQIGVQTPFIMAVAVDPAGVAWVGARDHLYRFDGTTFVDYAVAQLPSSDRWGLFAESATTLWIGLRSFGLLELEHQGNADPADDVITYSSHASDPGLPSDVVYDIARHHNGSLLVATRLGLGVKLGGTWTTYTASSSALPGPMITDILVDAGGDVWLATYGQGLARLDLTTGVMKVYSVPDGELHCSYVTRLAQDAQGKIYAASLVAGGVSVYDPSKDTDVTEDFLVGRGLGQPNANEVRLFTPAGVATAVDFYAYAAGKWGVNAASGDIDGGARAEVLSGPGPGDLFGPQIRGFDRNGTALSKVSFYAYGTLRYGANVASGAVDGDSFLEILTGPGPGAVFGPHVRGFDYDGTGIAAIGRISFFSYLTLKYGVNVASGDVDADNFGEIVTGAGPGAVFAPNVRGFNYDGTVLSSIAKINFNAFSALAYGANVAGGDVEGDGFAEMAAAPGPGVGASYPSEIRGFDYDGSTVVAAPGFTVTAFATTYGARLGLGDVTGDGSAELVAGAGRDPVADSTVKAYRYDGSTLTPLSASLVAFPGATYGVNVATMNAGY